MFDCIEHWASLGPLECELEVKVRLKAFIVLVVVTSDHTINTSLFRLDSEHLFDHKPPRVMEEVKILVEETIAALRALGELLDHLLIVRANLVYSELQALETDNLGQHATGLDLFDERLEAVEILILVEGIFSWHTQILKVFLKFVKLVNEWKGLIVETRLVPDFGQHCNF